MHKRIWSVLIAVGMTLMISGPVQSAVPPLVNYGGILTDGLGNPQVGTFSVTFSIYDAPAGGTQEWTEVQSVTTDSEGRFNVLLGSTNPLTYAVFLINTSERYLGIMVSPDPEMTPRIRIVTVPYAFSTASVEGATGGTISGDVSVIDGSVNLENSSATTGNIIKGGDPFIHNTGTKNTFVGANSGNLTLTGNSNAAIGTDALSAVTSGGANTAVGVGALNGQVSGGSNVGVGFLALNKSISASGNTAVGRNALYNATSGTNTACGYTALLSTTTGVRNTAIGYDADVSTGELSNATAIGAGAIVDADNKIRLGDDFVSALECRVGLTVISDKNEKENFEPVDGDEVLKKIREFDLTTWNYKGHEPKTFRHYGPMAQEFFAAFGRDGVGTVGTPTTINSQDLAGILMIAVQALEKRTVENAELGARIEALERRIAEGQTPASPHAN